MTGKNIKEEIRSYLMEIRSKEKKLKSKMSKTILKLKDFIKQNSSNMNDLEIEFLYEGDPETPGLLRFCSTKTKFSGSIKKSSLTTLKFLLDLMSDSNERFRVIFTQINSEEYKLLDLQQHCFKSEENKQVAFELARIIRDDRPYLQVEEYLPSNSVRKEFEAWYATQTKNKPQNSKSERKQKMQKAY